MAHGHSKLPPYRPQLALLVKTPPEGDDWLHELKLDGFRIGVAIDHGHVTLLSRREKDWTAEFPTVVAGAKKLPVKTALIDGELAGRLARRAHQHARDGRRRGNHRLLRVRHPSPRRRGPDGAAAARAQAAPAARARSRSGAAVSLRRPRRRRRRRVLPRGVPDEDRRHRLEAGVVAVQGERAQRHLAEDQVRRAPGIRDRRLRAVGARRSRRALARDVRGRAAGVLRQGRHRLPARGRRAAEDARADGTTRRRRSRRSACRSAPRSATRAGSTRPWCARSRSWNGPATVTSATARSRACDPTRIRARSCAKFRSSRRPQGAPACAPGNGAGVGGAWPR